MANYFIYAKDVSGSTRGVKYYHKNGLKTLDQFTIDVENTEKELLIAGEPPTESKIIYLHWCDSCCEVSEEKTRETYENEEGDWAGTEPETIIRFLQSQCITSEKDKIKLLYIITDGLIGYTSVNKCFVLNEDMHYEQVVFHAFNENLKYIDLSVASSFFKSRCMVYRNNELYDSTDISREFEYDKINLCNFATEKDQLKSYVKFKFIGKHNKDAEALQEIDKLKKLRDRLFDELSSKTVERDKSKVNLETKDRNVFLREFVNTDWYKDLSTAVHVEKVEIEKNMSALINYIVSDTKSYSFDALKFDKTFDQAVEEEQMVDVEFTPEQEIEFPDVILEDDRGIPVLILSKLDLLDKIIFHKEGRCSNQVKPASFSKFKSTMECPLFLMNDEDVSKSIGYFYTLNVYKQLLASQTTMDPRTRRPFHGGLVLTDTDEFDKYNDYILSMTYFDAKKVKYNVGLFYFVLWKNCENKEWMDRNVVEQFKKYTMRRIRKTVCKIGLSSLPLDPRENTSLLTALWYCVELSSSIFKNDPQNFKQERLCMYYGVTRYMIEILKYFNYELDWKSVEKRRDLVSHVMILKKIQKHQEKVYYLLKKIFKTVDGFLVSEIEKPSNLYLLNYLKLNHRGMLPDDVVDETVHLNDYVHLMHFVGDLEVSKSSEDTFKICDTTFRPFFAIDQNKSFYTELVENTRKVVINNDDDKEKIQVTYEAIDSLEFDRILSLCKLFIDCVIDLQMYPTFSEYVEFVCKRKTFNGNLVTVFPSNVDFYVKDVFQRYQNIVKNVTVNTFIAVCKSNVSRTERIKAEKNVSFSDDEISKFISSEELKVNLKKKT